ncbi:MAG: DUF2784 domain-containing protein [bacterium]|nr:DUF2784 domain-containing protein [bacterium]MDT8395803.1 DUF2784 domain-containing protein [bacterium]
MHTALPDILMIIHLLWVVFMIAGLPLGLYLGSSILRWAHLTGMIITGIFAVLGLYCPLTAWEEQLRWQADPGFSYHGSFLAERLSPVLYPHVEPWIIRTATIFWLVTTVISIFLVPGGKHRDRSHNGPASPGSGPSVRQRFR